MTDEVVGGHFRLIGCCARVARGQHRTCLGGIGGPHAHHPALPVGVGIGQPGFAVSASFTVTISLWKPIFAGSIHLPLSMEATDLQPHFFSGPADAAQT